MHTQTESAQEHPAGTASTVSAAAGLGLYLLTLTAEAMLGAGPRWLLFYLGAATVGAIVPLGLSAEELAWIAAVVPLAHSAMGLALPGQGRLWRLRLGARRMSSGECQALAAALDLLRIHEPRFSLGVRFYVLDNPLPAAAVRGRAVIFTRSLLESESLAAVLAHELGHLCSLDGRLTEALQRLMIWEDPLSPRQGSGGEVQADGEPARRGGLAWACTRWTLCLAGGGVGQRLLAPLWAPYWRAREYAADAYAASLGQAEDLALHLTHFALVLDAPRPGLPFNRFEHPPVALRIERLQVGGVSI